jgi:hypothetical protein
MKMPPIVLKLKGEKKFSVTLYMLRQALCRLAPPCPFQLPFPYFSDVAKARSYFASTVLVWRAGSYVIYGWDTHREVGMEEEERIRKRKIGTAEQPFWCPVMLGCTKTAALLVPSNVRLHEDSGAALLVPSNVRLYEDSRAALAVTC